MNVDELLHEALHAEAEGIKASSELVAAAKRGAVRRRHRRTALIVTVGLAAVTSVAMTAIRQGNSPNESLVGTDDASSATGALAPFPVQVGDGRILLAPATRTAQPVTAAQAVAATETGAVDLDSAKQVVVRLAELSSSGRPVWAVTYVSARLSAGSDSCDRLFLVPATGGPAELVVRPCPKGSGATRRADPIVIGRFVPQPDAHATASAARALGSRDAGLGTTLPERYDALTLTLGDFSRQLTFAPPESFGPVQRSWVLDFVDGPTVGSAEESDPALICVTGMVLSATDAKLVEGTGSVCDLRRPFDRSAALTGVLVNADGSPRTGTINFYRGMYADKVETAPDGTFTVQVITGSYAVVGPYVPGDTCQAAGRINAIAGDNPPIRVVCQR